MLLRFCFLLVVTVSLSACASKTSSDVSAADIPATKYKKIAVFIGHYDPAQLAPEFTAACNPPLDGN